MPPNNSIVFDFVTLQFLDILGNTLGLNDVNIIQKMIIAYTGYLLYYFNISNRMIFARIFFGELGFSYVKLDFSYVNAVFSYVTVKFYNAR